MARQFIYHMQGLTKVYPNGKKVLDNVHLSFYPDAKLGVLGVNGSGKCTLLKIMAGMDTEFAAIWGLMRVLERFSALPFVAYRLLLGVFLLVGVIVGFLPN